MSGHSVKDIFQAAEQRLETARFGLKDMSIPERAQSGLYNAVVFDRMITFSLQYLRGIVSNFDGFYIPIQEKMRNDPLMRFFHEFRTSIEKKVERHTDKGVYVESFSYSDLALFQPAPPGATVFFISSENGGCGWEVPHADGSVDRYYMDLPPEIGKIYLGSRLITSS